MPHEGIDFIGGWISYLLAIIPLATIAMITYQGTRKALTNDNDVIVDCKKKIRNTLKGAVIAETISGVITCIKYYYM